VQRTRSSLESSRKEILNGRISVDWVLGFGQIEAKGFGKKINKNLTKWTWQLEPSQPPHHQTEKVFGH
jgi:hypothetical protein